MNIKKFKTYSTISKITSIKPIGFSGFSIKDLFKFLYASLKNGNYSVKSSAIAFDFFTAIFPSMIFLITLLPLIPIDNFKDILLSEIKIISPPETFILFESTLKNLVDNKFYGLLSVGFLLVIYYSSNAFNTLIDVLNDSHLIKEHRSLKQRFMAFLLFLKFFLILSLTVLISLFFNKFLNFWINSENYLLQQFLSLFKWILVIYFLTLIISIVFKYAQSDQTKVKFINAGTLVTVLIILTVTFGLSYFFKNFSNYNKVYGSIAGLLISLIWIRSCCYVIVLGFDLYMKVGLKQNINTNEN